MKHTFRYYMAALLLLLTGVACKKTFLDKPSQNVPTLDTYYVNAEQVNGATALLYNQVWYNYIDKAFHCIGEVLAGNMLTSAGDPNYGFNTYVYFTVQSTDGQVLNAWQACYKVAGNATVLANTFEQKKGLVSGDKAYLDRGIAEARFIRGAAYFQIARIFGDVPIVTDPVALAASGNYNVPRYIQKDVLRFALEDFKAAEAGLAEASYQTGRVNKYSAIGMQAKVHLYLKEYDKAKEKALQVINSGKYDLYPDYKKMFTSSAANNNIESLFALQWVASGGYSYANAIQAYAGPSTLLRPDFNTGYSSVIPTIDLLREYEAGDKRKAGSVMQHGFSEPNWKNDNFPNGFVYDTTWKTSDDDAKKIKTGTRSNALKYIVGPLSSGEPLNTQGGSNMNIYMLRYADVLMIYAEAVLGTAASTSDATALAAVNKVRARAGLPGISVITPAAILHERRIELAFEGDYWFDIQRQGFNKAKQMLEAQERGTFSWDGANVDHLGITVNSESQLFLPIPQQEIVSNPELAKPAVPYY
ncbi:MAG: hypothetical protein RL172_1423 [Bacteroidota bacterium]|jgi:starch-binding outer membrane protein, SusD/RagB family